LAKPAATGGVLVCKTSFHGIKSKILLGMKHLGGKSMKFRSAYLIAAVVVSILTIPVCSEAAGPQIRGRFSFDGLANCDNPPIRNFPIHGEGTGVLSVDRSATLDMNSTVEGRVQYHAKLGGAPMDLGQIVPFEAVIGMSGAPGPERGTVEFSASWATHTTSNDEFGFDTNYMVYCAFVDAADPGSIDPNANARVQSISSTVINRGTIDEQIVGTFRVTGLDVGDQVVVEIWMVLDSVQPRNAGGTIARVTLTGTYTVNPDCTGSQTSNLSTGGVVHLDFVIVDGGQRVEFILVDPTSTFGGTQTRL